MKTAITIAIRQWLIRLRLLTPTWKDAVDRLMLFRKARQSPQERNWYSWGLAWILLRHPTYEIILADDADYPGTNWTWAFSVTVQPASKTIVLKGNCT